MERFSKLLILLNQPAAWSSCCKAGRQSSVLVLTRVLVLVLVTSRLELVTCSRSSRLMLVTSRIDLLHQVFTSSCIFTLLSLLHQPTIVLLYSRLKIRSKNCYKDLQRDLLCKHSSLGLILTPVSTLLQLPHRGRTLGPL